MKTKFGIVGCGFLGGIVANAWKNGLLADYELVGVTSRSRNRCRRWPKPSAVRPARMWTRCSRSSRNTSWKARRAERAFTHFSANQKRIAFPERSDPLFV